MKLTFLPLRLAEWFYEASFMVLRRTVLATAMNLSGYMKGKGDFLSKTVLDFQDLCFTQLQYYGK
jgi:hypothetical protein